MQNIKLSTKLYCLMASLIALSLVVGTIGLTGIWKTNAGLQTVYNDRVVHLKQLKSIADEYAVTVVDAVNKANAGLQSAEDTLKGVQEGKSRISAEWRAYRGGTLTAEENRLAQEAEGLFRAADVSIARLEGWLKGKTGSVKDRMTEFDGPLYASIDPISGKITELLQLQSRVAASEYQAAEARYTTLLKLSLTLVVAGGLAGAGVGWRTVRSVTRIIQRVAAGLAMAARQTVSAAGQVAAASQILADGASEQAASLEETSSSLEEMSSMTRRNAESVEQAAALARQARDAADMGAADMQAMTGAMAAIRDSSDDIAKIIKTIDEIAFQTNILALNAAVEAARAGEAGMGFAVVADEVRNLSQRSAQAAKETANKIEGAISKTAQGVEIGNKVASSLTGIVAKVRQVDQLVMAVAGASLEQAQGIAQINNAVGQMGKTTQGNAASAEESSSASGELNAQAEAMHDSVNDLLRIVDGERRSSAVRVVSSPAASGRRHSTAGPRAKPPDRAGGDPLRQVDRRRARAVNCWEFKKCGREVGGAKAKELGVCPAYPDHGRSCAAKAGTLCGGKIQGSFASKITNCMACEFFRSEHYEKGNFAL